MGGCVVNAIVLLQRSCWYRHSVVLVRKRTITDRATAAVDEVVPTFAGRGCYVVSATDSHGR
jgi:hypothetical protein